jgi:TPR repeat protein
MAENSINIAINSLIRCYKNEEKIEKNLKKAFYWYQKVAENGYEKAINNLTIYYKNRKETEKNFKKAFH